MKKLVFVFLMTACLSLAFMPAVADDYTLGIFGNANMDGTIDEEDIDYLMGILDGTNELTELADANYDGTIDEEDIIQVNLIIEGAEEELTFLDVFNEAETVEKPINNIVLGFNDIAEILRVLDSEDKIVGIDNYVASEPNFYPELSKLPIAGHFRDPNYEAILSLSPDAYMPWVNPRSPEGFGITKEEYREYLPGVALIFLNIGSLEEFSNSVTKLGYILDKEDEAEEFLNWYNGYLNTIKSRTEPLLDEDKPRAYLEFWSNYRANHHVEMVDFAGGINIADELIFTGGAEDIDKEWVVDTNPDIIVKYAWPDSENCGYETDDPSGIIAQKEEILNRAELANVNAIQNDRVYVLDMWHFGWGPSILISTAYMAKWFHPELFEDLDPQAIHQEYLTRFHGLDYDLEKHGAFVYPPVEVS